MCGVVGLYAYGSAAPDVNPQELRIIRDTMEKRGPDGVGEWLSADKRIMLGHRRLSIIDLSEQANQPMVNERGDLAISFNGEIYNYKELKRELEQKGFCFRTQSDTEVLLNLYADRQEKMFEALEGMYAFILWDGRKRKTLLARDPYGIKPLYYADDGGTLRVASQVKALLASPKVTRKVEPAGIVGFFLLGSVPEPFTLYGAIRAVPAGSYMWVDECGVSGNIRHFNMAKIFLDAEQTQKKSKKDLEEAIHSALLESVKRHFVADVPVGLFLSAGIDSGALLSLAMEAGIHNFSAVTLAFEEFKGTPNDELSIALNKTKKLGIKHHVSFLTRQEFEKNMPSVFQNMDQPSIDGINTYFVSKATQEAGFKVALSGVGGDELFGGYSSFKEVPRWNRLLSLPSRIPFAASLYHFVFNHFFKSLNVFHPKTAGLLSFGGTFEGSYFLKRGLFLPWELNQLLDGDVVRMGLRDLALMSHLKDCFKLAPHSDFSRMSILESEWYLKNQLLRDADWAGMAHSVEIRTPYVDKKLFYAVSPYACHMWPTAKKILKKIAAAVIELPEEKKRIKTGFVVPVSEWCSFQQIDGNADKNQQKWPWIRQWARYIFDHFYDQKLNHALQSLAPPVL